MVDDYDGRLRAAMFAYLDELRRRHGEYVRWADLRAFELDGRAIPLVGQSGIRRLKQLDSALTILTTYRSEGQTRPYDDGLGEDNYLRYKWRGTDPLHVDNVSLRNAIELGKPLTYFRGVAAGIYLAIYPVSIVGEEPSKQQFVVALDAILASQWNPEILVHPVDLARRREYALRMIRERVHQPLFRREVLLAYQRQCSLCRLRHPELLDAAHIKEDSDGGQPVLPNGVAMCAIHHRAFDNFVIGLTPDYQVQVRPDVLEEADGPTLRHALQGLHGVKMLVPKRVEARPDRELLEERFQRFVKAS